MGSSQRNVLILIVFTVALIILTLNSIEYKNFSEPIVKYDLNAAEIVSTEGSTEYQSADPNANTALRKGEEEVSMPSVSQEQESLVEKPQPTPDQGFVEDGIVSEQGSQKSPSKSAEEIRQENFEKIYKSNIWGDKESLSGPGSNMEYTQNVRKLVSYVIKKYAIKSLLDAPCGGKLLCQSQI